MNVKSNSELDIGGRETCLILKGLIFQVGNRLKGKVSGSQRLSVMHKVLPALAKLLKKAVCRCRWYKVCQLLLILPANDG